MTTNAIATRSNNSVTQIDTMMLAGSSRNVPWADLATQLDDAPTSDVALHAAGLDWTVQQTPMCFEAGGVLQYTDKLVNYRSDNNGFLGLVSKNYKPMNNADAFDFLDYIVDAGEAKYNSAGSLKDGKITFVSLIQPRAEILGDDYDRYLVVVNDHTGLHAIRIVPTNIRVSCMNTLNLMLREAKRIFSISHTGDVQGKLHAAKAAILASENYTTALNAEAERLVKIQVSPSDVAKLKDTLFAVPENATKKKIDNLDNLRSIFDRTLNADDLGNFHGTAYQLVQAAADFGMHLQPLRKSKTYNERVFNNLLTGNSYLDTTYQFVQSLAA